ncbi:hypothetical protein CC78DRAFT_546962 [Lojkania enalia]|uniref:BZIP domain-containing protein n=1 Tax=Lojkania enalia TaxID=147567 RepID=A0A9P4N062_9PLEO|nr:hypothetical protein CC78DRAFT_546962 [Didymosphaeria enalia]
MSPYHVQNSSGAPTFIAASASQSLSGLDGFNPLMDSNTLDSSEWYYDSSDQHHRDQVDLLQGYGTFIPSFGLGVSSHSMPMTVEAPSYPALSPMHGVTSQHDEGILQQRFDEIGTISRHRTTYTPYATAYTTPYPDSISSAQSEDHSLAEAEEDKRKRNQAASARFRRKKKQRDQQILEQSREMAERNKKLENEVQGLKKENTFLKKLLVEKVDNMDEEDRALLAKTAEQEKEA